MRNRIRYFIRSKLLPDSLFLNNKKGDSKSLYLTFDDGPVQGITTELINLLDEFKVKATFFVLGKCAKSHPEIIKTIHSHGHTIANHSYSHPPFHKISLKQQLSEVITTNNVVNEITNETCALFRAPQGRWNIKLLIELFRLKITAVHWSRDSMDFRKEDPSEIVNRFVDDPIKSGDIVLFHDDDPRCIEALRTLIPLWQAQGYNLKALENKH